MIYIVHVLSVPVYEIIYCAAYAKREAHAVYRLECSHLTR